MIDSKNFPVVTSPASYSISVVMAVTFQDATKKFYNLDLNNINTNTNENENINLLSNGNTIYSFSNNQTITAETRSFLSSLSSKNSEMQLPLRARFVLTDGVHNVGVAENSKQLIFDKVASASYSTKEIIIFGSILLFSGIVLLSIVLLRSKLSSSIKHFSLVNRNPKKADGLIV